MKYLVKYYEIYGDEFPVEGMMLLTEEEYKEFETYHRILSKKLDEGYEFEWFFGTNESIYYRRSKKWDEAFIVEGISGVEIDILERHIFNGQNYFGLMPDIEFMWNELNQEEYDDD